MAEGFSAARMASIAEEFNREGWVHLPGVLTPDEVAELHAGIERLRRDPTAELMHHAAGDRWSFVRLFERERIFRDMLVREPMIGLGEALIGPNCHLIADGAVYNPPGKAISGWHVDDGLYFPLPEGIPRHYPRVKIPNLIVNFQMMTGLPAIEYGPTQVVPRSHYAGRPPDPGEDPRFEGQGPVSIFCKAGDLYLQHSQLWHHGAPNNSDRRRCLYQFAYGDRRIAQRFYPFLNYRVPGHVLAGADERMLRLFGKHPSGAYG